MKIDRNFRKGLALFLPLLMLLVSVAILRSTSSSAKDFSCSTPAEREVTIDVRSGESGSEIAQELFDKGVTASYGSFFGVAVGDSRSGRIAPGLHKVEAPLCAKSALNQLLDSVRIGNLLAFNEGAWNSEIKKEFERAGYTEREVSKAFSSATLPTGFTSLEGLLFPAQYSFDTSTSVLEILGSMIERSKKEMSSAGFSNLGKRLKPAQLLIIASLLQAEGDLKDFAKISQVVRNRLAIGMPLQFDSTIHYIKGSRGSVFLSTNSTFINSPFNTYRHYGLPPTPINNPGAAAMYAAVHPESGPWLYFITVAPGDTRFTETLAQFNTWKVLYKKNLQAGKFGGKN